MSIKLNVLNYVAPLQVHGVLCWNFFLTSHEQSLIHTNETLGMMNGSMET